MNKYEVVVASSVYQAGITEDGEAFTAEVYFAVAVMEDGCRFEHDFRVRGCEVEYEPEEGVTYFMDVREKAIAKVEKLVAKIEAHLEAGGELDMIHWREIDPVYGSRAFQDQGIEEARWMVERIEALYAGAVL